LQQVEDEEDEDEHVGQQHGVLDEEDEQLDDEDDEQQLGLQH
jgi:hypothetical protein